jgi:hypothetical protein
VIVIAIVAPDEHLPDEVVAQEDTATNKENRN